MNENGFSTENGSESERFPKTEQAGTEQGSSVNQQLAQPQQQPYPQSGQPYPQSGQP
ncbi:MAG: hypothetical protein LIO44_06190 [Eubacterium sp.]|nr:hypothetical protein [Eubacterium sp.]